jgi:hypothetical protein
VMDQNYAIYDYDESGYLRVHAARSDFVLGDSGVAVLLIAKLVMYVVLVSTAFTGNGGKGIKVRCLT